MELTNLNKDRKKREKPPLEMPMIYGKVPPQAKEIEEAILGAIMLERDAFDAVAEMLKPECFYVDAHQRIFKAMRSLHSKTLPIDILTISEELRSTEELDMVGGAYYVTKLTNTVVSSANIIPHSRIVLQKYVQREVIRTAGELINQAYEDTSDGFDLLDLMDDHLSQLQGAVHLEEMKGIDYGLVRAMQQIEGWRRLDKERKDGLFTTGVPSGFKEIDMATRGWQKGDLIIIAARPSVGKTAFVLNLLKNAAVWMKANTGESVAIWSLEMKMVRLIMRLLAMTSKIWLTKILMGKLSDDDMRTIYTQGTQLLSSLKIYFDDQSGLTIQKLRAKARKLKRKNKLGLIIIDYLQLMIPEERSGTREQEVSKISRNLKNLAQELDIPIIALSQLSRAVETRKEGHGKPYLSDLRESGSLEQDSDLVMFLYNPSEADLLEAEREGTLEQVRRKKYISIAKQRDGMLIDAELTFQSDIQLFEEIQKAETGSPFGSGAWRPVRNDEMERKTIGDPDEEPF